MIRICNNCGKEADTFNKETPFICLSCKNKILHTKLFSTINQVIEPENKVVTAFDLIENSAEIQDIEIQEISQEEKPKKRSRRLYESRQNDIQE